MIAYGTDSGERRWIIVWLLVLAVITSPFMTSGLNAGLAYFEWKLPSVLESPSPLFIFGVLVLVFERWLWRIPGLRSLGIVKTPDLNGTWTGTLRSSHDELATEYPVTIAIDQEWLRMRVVFRTETSASHSTMAGVFVDDPLGTVLAYEYLNEPAPDTTDTMTIHRGTARLVLHEGEGQVSLEGRYYTSEPRMMYGTIHVVRTSREVIRLAPSRLLPAAGSRQEPQRLEEVRPPPRASSSE